MKGILVIKRILSILLLILVPVTFNACGGGGGGDSNPSAGGITYTGSTSQADIDENNAQEMIAGAFEAANSGMAATELPSMSIQQLPSDQETVHSFYALMLPEALKTAIVSTDVTNLSGRFFSSAVETESGTIYGDCGGQASYAFEANDVAGTFNGSMTFLSYCHDGVTISGQTNIQGTFDTGNGDPLTITITFDNLESDYIILNGEISMDLTMIPYVVTMNFYGKDKASGKVYWISNYILEITEGNGELEAKLSGKFYHPDYGYVVLTTPIPFIIYEGDDFPSSGTLVLTGANGTKAELNAIDYLHCECKLDSDGDGVYDWESGLMLWTDLHETDGEESSPPTPGDWSGTAGFGEIELVVKPNSTGLEKIVLKFIDFKCGILTSNLTLTATGSWTISNSQFTADFNVGGRDEMNIRGTFHDSGTYVSGTYRYDFDGTICPGTWEATPEI